MKTTGRMIGDITVADIRDFRDLFTAVTDEAQRFGFTKTLTGIARSPGSGDNIAAMPDEECLTWRGLARAVPNLDLGPRVTRMTAGYAGTVGAGTQNPLVPIVGDQDDWERDDWQGWSAGGSAYGVGGDVLSSSHLERPDVHFTMLARQTSQVTPPGTLAYSPYISCMLGEHICSYHARGATCTLRINVPRLNDTKFANCYSQDANNAPTFIIPEIIRNAIGLYVNDAIREFIWPPGTTIEGDAGSFNYGRYPYTETTKYHIHQNIRYSTGTVYDETLYSIDDVPLVRIWVPVNDWD